MDLTTDQIQSMISDALDERQRTNAFGVSLIPSHFHTGTDSGQIDYNNLINKPTGNATTRVRAFLSAHASVGTSYGPYVCDTESWDTNSEYNNTNGIFTALAAGYYQLTFQMTMQVGGGSSWTANDWFDVQILQNGSEISYSRNDLGTTAIGAVFTRTDTFHLVAEDTLQVKVKTLGAGLIMTYGDQTFIDIYSI